MPRFPKAVILGDQTTDLAAPSSGLELYSRRLAGVSMLYDRGVSGFPYPVAPHFAFGKVGWWTFAGGSATFQAMGLDTARTGTVTLRSYAATNIFTNARRVGMVSAAGAGSVALVRSNPSAHIRSSDSSFGGFFFLERFGISLAPSGLIVISGASAANPATATTAPGSHTHFIGMCKNSADTTFTVQARAAAGTASSVALGANFPATTTNTDLYEQIIYCPPNVSWVAWRVLRMNTGDVAQGVFDTAGSHSGSEITTNIVTSANLPAATTYLGAMVYASNNATASAAAFDLAAFYEEGDVT